MVQDISPGMSIIPTCIGDACLPNTSAIIVLANTLTIILLIGLARRHVRKSQA